MHALTALCMYEPDLPLLCDATRSSITIIQQQTYHVNDTMTVV